MEQVRDDKAHLVERYNLTETLLQKKCSKDHMVEIQKFISWNIVGRHFTKISRKDLNDIEVDGRDEDHKRDLLLGKVEDKYADDATYDLMITTMLKAEKVLEATNVCKLLQKTECEEFVHEQHPQGTGSFLHDGMESGAHSSFLNPLTYQGLSPAEMLSDEDVKKRLDDLNDRFNHMVTETQNVLNDSQADPRKIVNIIRLPDAKMTYTPPNEFFDQFKAAADAVDVFGIFGGYWDHFNYYLYERLILSRSTVELFAASLRNSYYDLRRRMIQYRDDMDYFRRHTTLKAYCKFAILRNKNVPKGFKKHIKKQNFETLQDVEDFRQKVAYKYKLWECLVFVKKIKFGSVLITLWIPEYIENLDVLPDTNVLCGDETTEKKGSVPTEEVPVESMIHSSVLMQAIASGDKAKVESLLDNGADPNEFDSEIDFTPLMEASESGNVEIVKLLLDKHADPNFTTLDGWTALMIAVRNGHYAVVDILLLRNAKPNIQDKTGWSALMAAVYKSYVDVALRIIEAGAIPDIQDNDQTNALLLAIALHDQDVVVDALLNHKPQLNLQDNFGETGLILACKKIKVKLVKTLLSMGADPNISNKYGETPVLIAVGLGNREILEELLKKDANPNIGAEPPLHVASSLETEDTASIIVELLLSHRVDIKQRDERGVTAFEIAEMMNYTDLSKKLHPHELTSRASREDVSNSLLSLRKHLRKGPLFLTN